MPSDEDKTTRGVFTTLLELHKGWTRIGFVAWPVVVAIGVATGFYSAAYGVAAIALLLFMAWIYFDARKHLSTGRNRRPKEDE